MALCSTFFKSTPIPTCSETTKSPKPENDFSEFLFFMGDSTCKKIIEGKNFLSRQAANI